MAEGFPEQQVEELQNVVDDAGQEIAWDEYGSLPDSYLMERFGISSEEGRQTVTYRGQTKPLAQVVVDERCPVGGWLEDAHADPDPNAVVDFFSDLSRMSRGEFTANVRVKTEEDYQALRAANNVKKN